MLLNVSYVSLPAWNAKVQAIRDTLYATAQNLFYSGLRFVEYLIKRSNTNNGD